MRDVDRFRGEVDKTTAAEMRRIAAEAEANGTYGTPVQFSSGWKGEYIGPEDSKDWYYAMGGVATVHPPEQPGCEPRIEMDYKTHVFDRYNWDGGKEAEIGPVTITDDSMAEMHRAGVAQEFNMSGSTDTRHYAGMVPPRRAYWGSSTTRASISVTALRSGSIPSPSIRCCPDRDSPHLRSPTLVRSWHPSEGST